MGDDFIVLFYTAGEKHHNECAFDLFCVRDKGKQRIVFVDKSFSVVSTFAATRLKQGILKTTWSGSILCSKQSEPAHKTAYFLGYTNTEIPWSVFQN